ncbi:MAG: tRNA dihydrouridine synthase DusB [Muribaculaceae bacterium]|nr:tRNA dihydrouridine synthase DusB [Muribaculaceae bacterium]
MKIGNIDLGNRPVMLAPMEDVTDQSFRQICREQGADMVYTEFVSADAVVRNIDSTLRKMVIAPGERPAAIQIYGRFVDAMVEAARVAEAAGPEVIDINFGCPVKKIAGKGAGAGMLRNIPLMLEITREVVKAVHLPVTVKTRLGWDHDSKIIVDLAEQLQDCGIAALTIHGRTRSQLYNGEADWTLIGQVKNNPRMHIPIIGNGDITSPQKLALYYDRYGVDGVMVGRASIGAPWIFREMKQYLATGEVPVVTDAEKMALIRRQIAESIESIDEYRGILHIRRHLAATPLFKGIRDFRPMRIAMLQASTRADLEKILDKIETDILPNR